MIEKKTCVYYCNSTNRCVLQNYYAMGIIVYYILIPTKLLVTVIRCDIDK